MRGILTELGGVRIPRAGNPPGGIQGMLRGAEVQNFPTQEFQSPALGEYRSLNGTPPALEGAIQCMVHLLPLCRGEESYTLCDG